MIIYIYVLDVWNIHVCLHLCFMTIVTNLIAVDQSSGLCKNEPLF